MQELERILLTDQIDWTSLNRLLNLNYEKTMEEIFKIFNDSFLNKSIREIDLILSNIEIIVLEQDIKYYKIIRSMITRANNQLSKDKIKNVDFIFRSFKFRLIDLNRKISEKIKASEKDNSYSIYYDWIFKQRNVDIVNFILKANKDFLNIKDNTGHDLFYNVLKYFADLDETNLEEIKYFQEIIIIFLEKINAVVIKESQYMEVLENNFKRHVLDIKRKMLEISQIDLTELERKYHISSQIHDSIYQEIMQFSFDRNGRSFIKGDFITIDGEEAECLDDAICLKPNKDGTYSFYVAITDIPSIVPFKSKTFYEALKRVETIYLPDKVIDLYHPYISKNICSLLPNVDRNVIIYKYLLDPRYEVDIDSLEIIKGIINVRSRLSYRQVNKQVGIDGETLEMLGKIYMMADLLKKRNKSKEEYRRIENMIKVSAVHHHSMFADRSISANIIQESMLLVNSTAPYYFSKRGLIYIFRNHKTARNIDKMKEIKKAIDTVLARSSSEMVSQDLDESIETLKQMYLTACYGTVNEGHQGLGFGFYSHSTSSGRRFADSFNQYLTHLQVFDGNNLPYLHEFTEEVVERINERKSEIHLFEEAYKKQLSRKRKLEDRKE